MQKYRLKGPDGPFPLREGTSRSRTGSRMVSGPCVSDPRCKRGSDTEYRVLKALLSHEFCVPSFCSICRSCRRRRRAEQDQRRHVLSESPAWALLMLARCTRSASAPVRLPQPPIRRTRPRSSPSTCWHLMRKRRRSAATVRAACYGCSTKVDNHRFMLVPPCYGLTTLLRRTLIYALGRSGSARRDPAWSTPPTVPFTCELVALPAVSLRARSPTLRPTKP